MPKEDLQTYLFLHGDEAIAMRKRYIANTQDFLIAQHGIPHEKKGSFYFNSNDMYRCWINYSPYFFREMFYAFVNVPSDHQKDLSIALGNSLRLRRYIPQILIPGAYLDDTIDDKRKLQFLDTVAAITVDVARGGQPMSFRQEVLYSIPKIREFEKRVYAQLLDMANETCEYLYFGDQQMGFVSYGLDRSIYPESNTLYQRFNFNKGRVTYKELRELDTVRVYPKHTWPAFWLVEIPSDPHLVWYRYLGQNTGTEQDWLRGHPPCMSLTHAAAVMDNKALTISEIKYITNVLRLICCIEKERRAQSSEYEIYLDYCYLQSEPIRNLMALSNTSWDLPKDAVDSIRNDLYFNKLKTEWHVQYNFELALKLIETSLDWAIKLSDERR